MAAGHQLVHILLLLGPAVIYLHCLWRVGEERHGVKVGLGLGRAWAAGTFSLDLFPLNMMRQEKFATEKELVVVRILIWACGIQNERTSEQLTCAGNLVAWSTRAFYSLPALTSSETSKAVCIQLTLEGGEFGLTEPAGSIERS